MRNIYATFNDPGMAERAGAALLDHGVQAEHISIVLPEGYRSIGKDGKLLFPKDTDVTVNGGITVTTLDDAQTGAAMGAGIGLVAGTLAALAAVFVPGVGLVLGGGALALAIGGMAGSTAAGAVAGGVTGYLIDLGVPANVTEDYVRVIRGGGALLTVFPTNEKMDLSTIESILAKYDGVTSSFMPKGYAAVIAEDESEFNTHVTKR